MKQITNILLYKKPVRFLECVFFKEETYYTGVAKFCDCSHTHIHDLGKRLEAGGLIKTWHDGRTKQVRLTDKGRQVATLMSRIIVELKRTEANK